MSMGSHGLSQPLPHSLVPSILWGSLRERSIRAAHSHCTGVQTEAPGGGRAGLQGGRNSSGWLMFIGFGKPKPGSACDIHCPSSLG